MSDARSSPPGEIRQPEKGQSLWGGRFEAKPAELMQAINVSIGFDKRLWTQDLAGSRAHAAMLKAQGIISPEDEAAIQGGLDRIEAEIRDGSFPFRDEFEDIHMNVEARLAEAGGTLCVGETAGAVPPRLPDGRLAYVRLRAERYEPEARAGWRDLLEREAADRSVYAFTKHEGVPAGDPYAGVGLAEWLVGARD